MTAASGATRLARDAATLIGVASGTLMATWPARVRTYVWTLIQRDRPNIRALAAHLDIDEADAAWIYTRSRKVGYPVALAEFEEWCMGGRAARSS
jgi:hypothetical protein